MESPQNSGHHSAEVSCRHRQPRWFPCQPPIRLPLGVNYAWLNKGTYRALRGTVPSSPSSQQMSLSPRDILARGPEQQEGLALQAPCLRDRDPTPRHLSLWTTASVQCHFSFLLLL